jgi:hypothetical protein
MKKLSVPEWHKQFKDGCENMEGDVIVIQDLKEWMKMLSVKY